MKMVPKSMTYMHDKRDSLQGCPSDQLGENGHKNMIKYNFVVFTLVQQWKQKMSEQVYFLLTKWRAYELRGSVIKAKELVVRELLAHRSQLY